MAAKSASGEAQLLAPRALAIALSTLALMLAAGSLAIANYSPHELLEGGGQANELSHDIDDAGLPIPVVGDELFVAPLNASCVSRASVVAEFLTQQSEIGGYTFEVDDGSHQQ